MKKKLLSGRLPDSAGDGLRLVLILVIRYAVITLLFIMGLSWITHAHAQDRISDRQVAAFVEALRLSAPNTGDPNDGLYSDWKIKWENITRWSKRCTGTEMDPAEFDADTHKAREILSCVMGKILREQYEATGNESEAVRRAASWWMTGDPGQYDAPKTRPYTEKVLSFYRSEESHA